jgi:glycosyltransferase involved in cell wall biosynthesis
MKITYLSSPIASQYGGGEKFLDDFTNGVGAVHEFIGSSKAVYGLFHSKRYKATLISGLLEPVSPRNVLLFPISILIGLYQFIRFYKTFQESDWIVSPTAHCETFFVIPWIKLFLRKPVLFMVHAPKVPKLFSVPPLNFILSKCWGSSPVVFVSKSQMGLWNSVGCNSKNQIVIYNGVEVSEYIFKTNGNNGKIKAIKIGFLARLHQEKGCDVLIKSLSSIKSTQNIEIVIAGDGLEKDNLMTLYEVQKLPANIEVSFVGFQSDTKAFYESLDLFVFPSRRESFGLVICEAMERGVSVLCSDIPSSLEVKGAIDIPHESELIFKANDCLDLASKIEYFIENQYLYLYCDYKKKLHDMIADKFGLERVIRKYNEILKI